MEREQMIKKKKQTPRSPRLEWLVLDLRSHDTFLRSWSTCRRQAACAHRDLSRRIGVTQVFFCMNQPIGHVPRSE